MIRSRLPLVLLLALCSLAVQAAPPGMRVVASPHSVKVTLDRLERLVRARGITVALRWDHAAKAHDAGVALRPTALLMFGNPKLGSQLFTAAQTAGIDLPMKMLAWEDAEGRVWLGYNDPQWLAERHAIRDRDAVLARMARALAGLAAQATGTDPVP